MTSYLFGGIGHPVIVLSRDWLSSVLVMVACVKTALGELVIETI